MLLIQTAIAPETAAIRCAGEPDGSAGGLNVVRIAGKQCAILETGMGPLAAERSTRRMLDSVASPPSLLLSIGWAGALADDLGIGDWLLVERVYHLNSVAKSVAADRASVQSSVADHTIAQYLSAHTHLIPEDIVKPEQKAALVTLSEVAFTPVDKARIAAQVPARLCDMETYAVARVCQQAGIPWIGARIVSDTTTESIKPWTTALPGLIARRRYLRLATSLATHPQDWPTLVRLGFRMRFLQQQIVNLTKDLVAHVNAA